VAVPLGKETSDKAPAPFVGTSDETVEGFVLARGGSVGLPTANDAGTPMDVMGGVVIGR
jgi:hypothetical protein